MCFGLMTRFITHFETARGYTLQLILLAFHVNSSAKYTEEIMLIVCFHVEILEVSKKVHHWKRIHNTPEKNAYLDTSLNTKISINLSFEYKCLWITPNKELI
jgi:hypothetical protein